MKHILETDAEGWIVQCHDFEDAEDTPEGATFSVVATPPNWAAPTRTSRLRLVGGTPVWVETASLADKKASKNSEINAARLAANRKSFPFSGKAIACDELSMLDIQSANSVITLTGAMPVGWPGGWKAIDNTYVSIPDLAAWTAFISAMVAAGMGHFAHSQSLKTTLAAAQTIEEVEAITWGTQ